MEPPAREARVTSSSSREDTWRRVARVGVSTTLDGGREIIYIYICAAVSSKAPFDGGEMRLSGARSLALGFPRLGAALWGHVGDVCVVCSPDVKRRGWLARAGRLFVARGASLVARVVL